MKCTIAVFPSPEVQERANSYRKRYDSHFTLIQPHIKLKWPFDITEGDLPDIEKEIQKAAEKVDPIDLTFHKIKTFYPNSNVIYFGVQDTGQLETLHNMLNEDVLKREEKYVFTPHLTIAQDMNQSEFHDVLGRLKMINLKMQSKVDRIHLLYQLGDKTWTVHQTFILGKK